MVSFKVWLPRCAEKFMPCQFSHPVVACFSATESIAVYLCENPSLLLNTLTSYNSKHELTSSLKHFLTAFNLVFEVSAASSYNYDSRRVHTKEIENNQKTVHS